MLPTVAKLDFLDLLDGAAELAVGETDVVYSKLFAFPVPCTYSVEYKIESEGDIDVGIVLEVSNEKPAVDEQVADGNFVAAETITANEAGTAVIIKSVLPPTARYGRLRFTGNGSNAASTKVTRARLAFAFTG